MRDFKNVFFNLHIYSIKFLHHWVTLKHYFMLYVHIALVIISHLHSWCMNIYCIILNLTTKSIWSKILVKNDILTFKIFRTRAEKKYKAQFIANTPWKRLLIPKRWNGLSWNFSEKADFDFHVRRKFNFLYFQNYFNSAL